MQGNKTISENEMPVLLPVPTATTENTYSTYSVNLEYVTLLSYSYFILSRWNALNEDVNAF